MASSMEVSSGPLPDRTSSGPKRVRLGNYLLADSIDNTSSRCVGCHTYLYLLLATIALFDLRQLSYIAQGDFDLTVTMTSALAATGYVDYFVGELGGEETLRASEACMSLFLGETTLAVSRTCAPLLYLVFTFLDR